MSDKKVHPDTNISTAQSVLQSNGGNVGVRARYITTTLPYVNADPHVGFALEAVQADTLARYWRLMGHEVFFNTGTDEHGQKIAEKADEARRDRQEYVDHYAAEFGKLKEALNLSYDNFIRTTNEDHKKAAQELWKRCFKKGDIYKKKYKGLYCVGDEMFMKGSELVDGKCPNHPNMELQEIEEENYFFKLSNYKNELVEYLSQPGVVVPKWRRLEALKLVEDSPEDFSISRQRDCMDWGIQVPDDAEQVMYVWFDALTNYISTLGWPEDDEGNFKKFWEEGQSLQLAGKDQIRFQSVMWQAMLKSAGLPTTDAVLYHGFINSGGQKMSKSLGNVIHPYDLVKRYGVDATRYILLRHVHPFDDSDLTQERMDEYYTANLVNGLGNLTARIMKMAETHLDGPIERPEVSGFEAVYTDSLDSYEIQKGCDFVWSKIGELDERIATEEPFKVIKEDKGKGIDMIKSLVHDLYIISRMLNPIMPEANVTIKEAILANKKPKNLFARLEN
ncbi:methionine--tRNA ligase [Candidatus Pacebacteria bacterium]|nr:methionine--tRNA ligase [Candidatus Paceibacterota bacterium]